ncbi:MAG: malto-oligosyltrehalose synthase, partial [Clostridia bacterium]|nr:malto-oligosyltrehalose synthase [Deltaproteobacteria bacterium]
MTPNATYRIQLTPDFGFDAAAKLAPYLQQLGVSHAYLAPHLQAAQGSTHGYDVIDHAKVSTELGGPEAHARMFEAFRQHGLSVVVDVVPNHMSIAKADANAWWWDVLENGPSSRWADYFDVDWGHPDARNRNRVFLPVLGDHYGQVLEDRQISVIRDGGRIMLKVYDNLYPVGPRSIGWLLQPVAAKLQNDALAFIADVLEDLPSPTELDDESRRRRHRHKSGASTLLANMIEDDPAVAAAIDERLATISGNLDQLDTLVERLNFRLAYWRAARFDLDYRRFFDINELVGLRMDQAKVFADTHALILDWVRAGHVTGLRIDHPDGLIDPQGYFERLRAHVPHAWIVVEKILEGDETLPTNWPVQGTTGYDFNARVSGLWIQRDAKPEFDALYTSFTGAETADFHPVATQKKRDIVRQVLVADVRRITERFLDVCQQRRAFRDVTRDELKTVIETMLIAMPVYRTYGHPNGDISEHDVQVIATTTTTAIAVRPEIDVRLFEL